MSAATALRPRLGQMCLNQKSPLLHSVGRNNGTSEKLKPRGNLKP
jgi:hypothetical protein